MIHGMADTSDNYRYQECKTQGLNNTSLKLEYFMDLVLRYRDPKFHVLFSAFIQTILPKVFHIIGANVFNIFYIFFLLHFLLKKYFSCFIDTADRI